MILYTNGCSHTKGDDRALGDDFATLSWPNHLYKKMIRNLPGSHSLYNAALSGNNNKVIISNVVNDLTTMPKPDYVVIQFSYTNRFWTPFSTLAKHVDMETAKRERADQPYTFGKFHQPTGSLWNIELQRAEPDDGLKKFNTHETIDPQLLSNPTFNEDPRDNTTLVDYAFYDQYYRGQTPTVACNDHHLVEVKLLETFLKSMDIEYTFIIWGRMYINNYTAIEKSIDHSRILNYDHGEFFDMDRMMPSLGFSYPENSQHHMLAGQKFIAEAVYRHKTKGAKLVPRHKMSSNYEEFIEDLY